MIYVFLLLGFAAVFSVLRSLKRQNRAIPRSRMFDRKMGGRGRKL